MRNKKLNDLSLECDNLAIKIKFGNTDKITLDAYWSKLHGFNEQLGKITFWTRLLTLGLCRPYFRDDGTIKFY